MSAQSYGFQQLLQRQQQTGSQTLRPCRACHEPHSNQAALDDLKAEQAVEEGSWFDSLDALDVRHDDEGELELQAGQIDESTRYGLAASHRGDRYELGGDEWSLQVDTLTAQAEASAGLGQSKLRVEEAVAQGRLELPRGWAVEGAIGKVGGEASLTADGAALGGTASLGEIAIDGTRGDNERVDPVLPRLGVGQGMGAQLRYHNADTDGDGHRECGPGLDLGPVSLDLRSELAPCPKPELWGVR